MPAWIAAHGPTAIAYLVAFVAGVPLGGFFTGRLVRSLREQRTGEPDRRDGIWHTAAVAQVERAIVFGGVVAGRPAEVIAAWLVLKAAMSWHQWQGTPGVFNAFAVGTGLNVIWATCAALAPTKALEQDWLALLGLVVFPPAVLASVAASSVAPPRSRRLREAFDIESGMTQVIVEDRSATVATLERDGVTRRRALDLFGSWPAHAAREGLDVYDDAARLAWIRGRARVAPADPPPGADRG